MNILHFMEVMVYNYGKTKSKEDKTKILRKGAHQILPHGFFRKVGKPPPPPPPVPPKNVKSCCQKG